MQRTIGITCILSLVHLVSCDYTCLCNYAVDEPIYTSKDLTSPIQGHVYEFDCKPKDTSQSSDINWVPVIHNYQIGFLHKNSNIREQDCKGDPDITDTVTTGVSTMSTTTSRDATSSSASSTLPSNYTSTSLTTSTLKTTPKPSTTTKHTSTTTPLTSTTTPYTTTIPTATHAPTTLPSTTHAPTTKPSTTHAPTTQSTTTLLPTTTTKTTHKSTTKSTTAHTPTTKSSTHVPTSGQQSYHQSTAVVTQNGGYHCPRNVVSYAMLNQGRYRVHGTSCYEIVPYLATWENAEYNCQSKGGHLVHMSNLDEENAVMRFLYDNGFKHDVWIGLNDLGHEETFTWSSGDRFVWSKWMPDRKSNFYHHVYENCVVLVPFINRGFLQTYGQWDDIRCNTGHPWICRYDAVDVHGYPVQTSSSQTTRPPFLAALDNIMHHATSVPATTRLPSLSQIFHNIFGKRASENNKHMKQKH